MLPGSDEPVLASGHNHRRDQHDQQARIDPAPQKTHRLRSSLSPAIFLSTTKAIASVPLRATTRFTIRIGINTLKALSLSTVRLAMRPKYFERHLLAQPISHKTGTCTPYLQRRVGKPSRLTFRAARAEEVRRDALLTGRQAVPACSWGASQRQKVRRDALLTADRRDRLG